MIFVTGANGFLGRALLERLITSGKDPVGGARSGASVPSMVATPPLEPMSDWTAILPGCTVVVHCAGIAHVVRGTASVDQAAFDRVNWHGTLRLAEQAALCGVKRFIFVSSIGVNGAGSNHAYNEDDLPRPEEAYARSKWSAEQGLRELAVRSGMEVTIIRPPLIAGKGAKGNFPALVKIVSTGVPLPFKGFQHARSIISISNLLDFIELAIDAPAAANESFLVSDDVPLSTSELCLHISQGLGQRSRQFYFPPAIIEIVGRQLGWAQRISRLNRQLLIDASKAKALLGWRPKQSSADGVMQAVR